MSFSESASSGNGSSPDGGASGAPSAPDSRSTPDPEALLNRLAEERWTLVARHAWRQYQDRGRGAIVFRLDAEGQMSAGREPLRYVTFPEASGEPDPGPFRMLYRLVQSYDPETEAVVAAQIGGSTTVFDVYQGDPPPPAADAGSPDVSSGAGAS
jgi:hypothetical protein